MRNYGSHWPSYPSMTQDQYNYYLQSYIQQHNQGYFMPAPSPYYEYEYLVSQGIIPREQPPPPKTHGHHSEFDDPEEIEKWLAQRRKNFPTRERIEVKKDVEKMREERGLLKKSELSKLEIKLRQKIKFLDNEPKNKKKNKGARKNKKKKLEAKKEVPPMEIEEGEIVQVKEEQGKSAQSPTILEEDKNNVKDFNKQNKKKDKSNAVRFKYRKNNLFNLLVSKEVNTEHNTLLQIFRYFVRNKIV